MNDTSEAIDFFSIHTNEYKPTPTKTQSNNRVNNILEKKLWWCFKQISLWRSLTFKYFFEKIIIEANNTELVKFKLMKTPLFVDKYYTGVQKNGTCAKKNDTRCKKNVTRCKKMSPLQKSYLHNIKLYDFYLKIIHIIFNFF